MTSRQDVLIGLDIGTTKVCTVAFGVPNGRLLAVEDAPNNTNLMGAPDALEQDADRLAIALGVTARAVDRHGGARPAVRPCPRCGA